MSRCEDEQVSETFCEVKNEAGLTRRRFGAGDGELLGLDLLVLLQLGDFRDGESQ